MLRLQTPTVMTPLPPPPKWQARGSAQLGALLASPAAAKAAPPPVQRPSVGRRSVQARSTMGSMRRDSSSGRGAALDMSGDFRRSSETAASQRPGSDHQCAVLSSMHHLPRC